jgi:hypothetical protein
MYFIIGFIGFINKSRSLKNINYNKWSKKLSYGIKN